MLYQYVLHMVLNMYYMFCISFFDVCYAGRQNYHAVTSLEPFLMFTADDIQIDIWFIRFIYIFLIVI